MPKKVIALGGGAATGTVTAPLSLTNNVIPKASGASTLTDSSLTDNGITVSTPELIAAGDGGVSGAAFQFASQAGLGLFRRGAGQLGITANTTIGWFDSAGWHGFGTVVESFNDSATSADGLVLDSNGSASAGVQKLSPRIRLSGVGWRTNATAQSEIVDWIIENLPVQGTADPSTNLNISSQINAGGYVRQVSLTSTGELDIGPQDSTNNAVLGLRGKTSGTATFTAPAVAGTATNNVLSSNAITFPDGVVGTPSVNFVSNPTTGFWNNSNSISWSVNGTVRGNMGNGTFSIGNSSQVLFSGNKIATYNAIATVDNGVPSELGHLDLTAQAAAIAATTIYTPTATGRFRISAYLKVTTPATNSSILGGATGVTLTFTDGTDSVAQSRVMALKTSAGAISINAAGNSTTTTLSGDDYIYAKTGVAIQLAIDYTSVGVTAMQFCARATAEAM